MKTGTILTGKIIKIHSDFIYVKCGDKIFESKARERLKKEKIGICVGDNVKIEAVNSDILQAAITEVFERNNYIPHPSIANVDRVIIVASLAEPGLDFVQLNRYLCRAKLSNIPALICINKIDLGGNENNMPEKIRSIYEPLNYKVVFTSALEGLGIELLQKQLAGKVSVLAGKSGVGKSSLLNNLCPGLGLRTKDVSGKTGQGIHTTRHIELMEISLPNENDTCQIADTPGFSYLRFDNIMPSDVINLFDEIKIFSDKCYFSDCLHLSDGNLDDAACFAEKKCNVISNLDKIDKTRYLSYKTFVKEAFDYKKQIEISGKKKETAVKTIDSAGRRKIRVTKVGTHAKEDSRKKSKQKMNQVSILDEVYYNKIDLD